MVKDSPAKGVAHAMAATSVHRGETAFMMGYLQKQGMSVLKNWKRRLCVLKAARLDYYEKPGDAAPKGSLALDAGSLAVLRPDAAAPNAGVAFAVRGADARELLVVAA